MTATEYGYEHAEQVSCAHSHAEEEPVISESWKWMTVIGNAAIGACELATGNLATLSVASDGLHNVGDTATYYMQAENIVNPNLSDQRRQKLRKVSHCIIAASSLGISIKAGFDMAHDHESAQNVGTIYAAAASLALNGLMLNRFRSGVRRRAINHTSTYEKDLSKHFWAVDIPSAALALAGSVLQRYNVGIEQTAALASGLVGAFAFRPTKANLSHNCLSHDHSHQASERPGGKHRYAGPRRPSSKSWLERASYEPRHARPHSWRQSFSAMLQPKKSQPAI
jgi:hypothetical protein